MSQHIPADGMNLRDYFAGQIAAALLIAPKQPGVLKPDNALLAKMAYDLADHLILERG